MGRDFVFWVRAFGGVTGVVPLVDFFAPLVGVIFGAVPLFAPLVGVIFGGAPLFLAAAVAPSGAFFGLVFWARSSAFFGMTFFGETFAVVFFAMGVLLL